MKIAELDIIFLSYDESMQKKIMQICLQKFRAKRVHGVEGSRCPQSPCRIAETDRFITVDGDNTIRPRFYPIQVLDFDEHTDLENSVISWCGKNTINGLMYGNGGLKCWPKEYVLNMRTHENADPDNIHAQVDFCWDINYIHKIVVIQMYTIMKHPNRLGVLVLEKVLN